MRGLAGLGDATSDILGVSDPTFSYTAPAASVAASSGSSWSDTLNTIVGDIGSTIKTLAPVVASVKTANSLNNINVARAKAGQPAIDLATYNAASAPTGKVIASVDGTTIAEVVGGALLIAVVLASRNKSKSKG
jgi:hypothetical protein